MTDKPKHQKIYEFLHEAIADGSFRPGDRLPSDNDLGRQFATSRPTVARALRDLQHLGLVERRAGSGTFVRKDSPPQGGTFGLLIPNLGETEIFEPICAQMAHEAQVRHYTLLWGDVTGDDRNEKAEQALHLCQSYLDRQVSGVFFAPLELSSDKDTTNQKIVEKLSRAAIPIVLLDRDIVPFPQRSRYDLIGIDNFRSGYLVTEHLLQLGLKRIDFFAKPHSAPTVSIRMAGYRAALWQAGIAPRPEWVHSADPSDRRQIEALLAEGAVEAVVCANDVTAGHLMHTLDALGVDIPEQVRVAAFDDVKYAKLLRVPLTTVHQPCRDIGRAAVDAMLARIADPKLPPRSVLFDTQLVVRESCGAAAG